MREKKTFSWMILIMHRTLNRTAKKEEKLQRFFNPVLRMGTNEINILSFNNTFFSLCTISWEFKSKNDARKINFYSIDIFLSIQHGTSLILLCLATRTFSVGFFYFFFITVFTVQRVAQLLANYSLLSFTWVNTNRILFR